jgi:hypothetical protein
MMRAKGKIKDGAGKTDQMGVYHDPDMKEAQTAMLRAADSKEFNDYITSIGGVKISSATPKKVTSPKKVATPKTSKAQNKVTPKPTPSKKAPKATAQKKGGMFNGMKV